MVQMVQMVMVVWLQQISYIIIISTNCCSYIFSQKSLPGGVPDQALLLAVGVAGHHPDGHGRQETTIFKHFNHPEQLLLLQLCPKRTSWGCPWSGSTPGCWSGWTPPRWSWWSRNNKFQKIIINPNNISNYNFAIKSLPGGVPDQALIVAVGVAGHHQDGHGRP